MFRNERANAMSAVTSAVIEFPAGRVRPASRASEMDEAEIIIFPGVRVERMMFDLAERLPAVRNGSSSQPRGDFDFY